MANFFFGLFMGLMLGVISMTMYVLIVDELNKKDEQIKALKQKLAKLSRQR